MSDSNLSAHDDAAHAMDLDLADENQIIEEISGRLSEKYIYELKGVKDDRGQPVIGLSYAGTNWACREFARQGEVIRITKYEDKSTPDEPDYYKIAVMAQRFSVDKETGKEIALDSNVSGKRQWKMMKKNKWENGQKVGEEIVPDPFAWEKCLSKATRNAKQALMPTEMVKKLIGKAIENRSGASTSKVGRPSARPATSKPAQDTATTQAQPTAQAQTQGTSAQGSTASKQTSQASQSSQPTSTQPAAPKMSKEVMIQKLDAVSKLVFATQDGAEARQKLAVLTGKASPSELSEEDIKKVGNAINAVAKKTAVIEGNNIVKLSDKTILWKGPEVQAPPVTEPEGAGAASEADMF